MRAKKVKNTLIHIFLAVLALVWIFPIVWIILTSFRAASGAYSDTFIPEEFTIRNFVRLFTETGVFNFGRWFVNTFVIAVFTCILATFYLVSIAYVMSRLRFRSRKPLLNMALILGMFPSFMSMIAVYYILKGVGLTEGAWKMVALILVYSGGSGILQFYVQRDFLTPFPGRWTRRPWWTAPPVGACFHGLSCRCPAPLWYIRF